MILLFYRSRVSAGVLFPFFLRSLKCQLPSDEEAVEIKMKNMSIFVAAEPK